MYCDNFFTSLFLLEDLLKDGIYGCGTIRTNRKGFPDELKAVIAAKCLKKKGEMKTVQCKTSSLKNLTVTAWKDTKVVCVAATNSTPEVTTEVKRKLRTGERVVVPCPNSIATYNKYMGGVDRNDQLRQYYPVRLKCRKNYKYFFWFIFDVVISNSYIFAKLEPNHREKYKNLKSFRIQLANELTANYNSRKRRGRKYITSSKKFKLDHFPKRSYNMKQHKCFYCSKYLGKRKDTTWFCEDCQLHFCHGGSIDCFLKFHTQHLREENQD